METTPSIMNDNNDFDWETIDNLKDLIKEGQNNFNYLVTNGNLKNGNPTDLDYLLNISTVRDLITIVCDKTNPDNFILKEIFEKYEEHRVNEDGFDGIANYFGLDPIFRSFILNLYLDFTFNEN